MEYLLAVPPQTNEAFLREVDEELRREQALNFWRRYGRWLVAAVVGGLAVLGGVLYWQSHLEQLAGEESEKYSKVYDQLVAGQKAQAEAPLKELAASNIPAYRALATFLQADLLIQNIDEKQPERTRARLKAAAAKFALVANDQSIAEPLRNLALIRQTSAEFDELPPQKIIDRLKPLAVKGGPWLGSAGEMSAAAYLQLHRNAEARSLLKLIADGQDIPETLRQRAVQLAGSIGEDAAVNDKESTLR